MGLLERLKLNKTKDFFEWLDLILKNELNSEIKAINFNLYEDTDNKLSNHFDDVRCVFRDIYSSRIDLYHNIIGKYCILMSDVSDTDIFLLEYKKAMEGILPLEILQKLVCYSIYTNEGTVKIVSEGNVEIVNG